jgi:hypothetical protein
MSGKDGRSHLIQRVGLLLLALVISSCGGGGSGGDGGGSQPPPPAQVTPPTISYSKTEFTFAEGTAVTTLRPTVGGGAVTSWSITPALPAGLTFNATDGSISGTPAAETAAASYTVTAQNSGGSATSTLNVIVESGLLFDLGHAVGVALLDYAGTRAFSIDIRGRWNLWNTETAARVAYSALNCSGCYEAGDIAGSTLVLRTENGLQVRSATDGSVLSNIDTTVSWWRLASDGSYVAAGNTSAVRAWSTNGTLLTTRPGDYSTSHAFAAPGELRLAAGPAGAGVVEKVAVATGTTTTVPFQGEFHAWFKDGARFLTRVSNTVWVYSHDGTQQDLRILPHTQDLAGMGRWYWTHKTTFGSQVEIYEVGVGPTVTYPIGPGDKVFPSGNTLGLLASGAPEVSVVDLSGTAPVKVDHAIPVAYPVAYAALSGSQWLVANMRGVVSDASDTSVSPKYFSLGEARSIVGRGNRVAIATSTGKIRYFDAQTKAQEGEIDFSSSKLALSDDGTKLLALASTRDGQYQPDRSIKLFELPSGTEVFHHPYAEPNYPVPMDITLSGSGTVFGVYFQTYNGGSPSWTYTRQVSTIAGVPIWSDTVSADNYELNEAMPIHLSTDGTRIAVADRARSQSTGTNLYTNGTLSTATPGWVAGWIDNDRMLVNKYDGEVLPGMPSYAGASIVSASGQVLSSPTLPQIGAFQTVTSDSLYVPGLNVILSLTTGDTLWSSSQTRPATTVGAQGAVAGGRVVFATGTAVRAEKY